MLNNVIARYFPAIRTSGTLVMIGVLMFLLFNGIIDSAIGWIERSVNFMWFALRFVGERNGLFDQMCGIS